MSWVSIERQLCNALGQRNISFDNQPRVTSVVSAAYFTKPSNDQEDRCVGNAASEFVIRCTQFHTAWLSETTSSLFTLAWIAGVLPRRFSSIVRCRLASIHCRMNTSSGPFAWRVVFKHDTSLWERKVVSLSSSICVCMCETTRIVGTAHEEQGVYSILLRLLTRHTENTRSWRGRHSGPSTEVAVVFTLIRAK